jgi:xylulokinase
MILLGLDIGSTSVKAGILRAGGRLVGRAARVGFETRFDGTRADVDANEILRAVYRATRQLDLRRVECVALSTMSPSWLAMDRRGRAITPVVTHQDRRSITVAKEIEARVGKTRHLRLAGNRPFPGGISSTTCAWFLRNARATMRRADLVGHLSTFLHRTLTGSRVTDPSQASFMGLYRTLDLGGWSDELCAAVGVSTRALPQVLGSEEIGGLVTRDGARLLGVRHGTPMLTGLTDTGAAMLLAGARPGQLVNVSGSTDVLALCTDRPVSHERLLTRALGVGRLWMSVSTVAAGGSAFDWVKECLFAEMPWPRFTRLISRAATSNASHGTVTFDPYLAGDRASIDQPTAAFRGLTLATTRIDMLAAVVEALARASAERVELLKSVNRVRINRRVVTSGGAVEVARDLLHRDWKGKWQFRFEDEATLRGLAMLVPH